MNVDSSSLRNRLGVLHVTGLLFLIGVILSLPSLRGSGRHLDYLGNLGSLVSRFFPPDWSVSGRVLAALGETVQIAFLATFFAILLSIPLALAGAQNIAPRWLSICARMAMNVIRTIPSLIWALIAVAIVGPNSLAGVIALTFYSMGYLGKFFSDAFESADPDVAQALRAMGAGVIQSFQHGMWPFAKPLVWSHSLWMLEYNIRSAAIIGYVGAGGVGVQLYSYQEYYQWDRFCTVLIYILALVVILDLAGERIRASITKRLVRPLGTTV